MNGEKNEIIVESKNLLDEKIKKNKLIFKRKKRKINYKMGSQEKKKKNFKNKLKRIKNKKKKKLKNQNLAMENRNLINYLYLNSNKNINNNEEDSKSPSITYDEKNISKSFVTQEQFNQQEIVNNEKVTNKNSMIKVNDNLIQENSNENKECNASIENTLCNKNNKNNVHTEIQKVTDLICKNDSEALNTTEKNGNSFLKMNEEDINKSIQEKKKNCKSNFNLLKLEKEKDQKTNISEEKNGENDKNLSLKYNYTNGKKTNINNRNNDNFKKEEIGECFTNKSFLKKKESFFDIMEDLRSKSDNNEEKIESFFKSDHKDNDNSKSSFDENEKKKLKEIMQNVPLDKIVSVLEKISKEECIHILNSIDEEKITLIIEKLSIDRFKELVNFIKEEKKRRFIIEYLNEEKLVNLFSPFKNYKEITKYFNFLSIEKIDNIIKLLDLDNYKNFILLLDQDKIVEVINHVSINNSLGILLNLPQNKLLYILDQIKEEIVIKLINAIPSCRFYYIIECLPIEKISSLSNKISYEKLYILHNSLSLKNMHLITNNLSITTINRLINELPLYKSIKILKSLPPKKIADSINLNCSFNFVEIYKSFNSDEIIEIMKYLNDKNMEILLNECEPTKIIHYINYVSVNKFISIVERLPINFLIKIMNEISIKKLTEIFILLPENKILSSLNNLSLKNTTYVLEKLPTKKLISILMKEDKKDKIWKERQKMLINLLNENNIILILNELNDKEYNVFCKHLSTNKIENIINIYNDYKKASILILNLPINKIIENLQRLDDEKSNNIMKYLPNYINDKIKSCLSENEISKIQHIFIVCTLLRLKEILDNPNIIKNEKNNFYNFIIKRKIYQIINSINMKNYQKFLNHISCTKIIEMENVIDNIMSKNFYNENNITDYIFIFFNLDHNIYYRASVNTKLFLQEYNEKDYFFKIDTFCNSSCNRNNKYNYFKITKEDSFNYNTIREVNTSLKKFILSHKEKKKITTKKDLRKSINIKMRNHLYVFLIHLISLIKKHIEKTVLLNRKNYLCNKGKENMEKKILNESNKNFSKKNKLVEYNQNINNNYNNDIDVNNDTPSLKSVVHYENVYNKLIFNEVKKIMKNIFGIVKKISSMENSSFIIKNISIKNIISGNITHYKNEPNENENENYNKKHKENKLLPLYENCDNNLEEIKNKDICNFKDNLLHEKQCIVSSKSFECFEKKEILKKKKKSKKIIVKELNKVNTSNDEAKEYRTREHKISEIEEIQDKKKDTKRQKIEKIYDDGIDFYILDNNLLLHNNKEQLKYLNNALKNVACRDIAFLKKYNLEEYINSEKNKTKKETSSCNQKIITTNVYNKNRNKSSMSENLDKMSCKKKKLYEKSSHKVASKCYNIPPNISNSDYLMVEDDAYLNNKKNLENKKQKFSTNKNIINTFNSIKEKRNIFCLKFLFVLNGVHLEQCSNITLCLNFFFLKKKIFFNKYKHQILSSSLNIHINKNGYEKFINISPNHNDAFYYINSNIVSLSIEDNDTIKNFDSVATKDFFTRTFLKKKSSLNYENINIINKNSTGFNYSSRVNSTNLNDNNTKLNKVIHNDLNSNFILLWNSKEIGYIILDSYNSLYVNIKDSSSLFFINIHRINYNLSRTIPLKEGSLFFFKDSKEKISFRKIKTMFLRMLDKKNSNFITKNTLKENERGVEHQNNHIGDKSILNENKNYLNKCKIDASIDNLKKEKLEFENNLKCEEKNTCENETYFGDENTYFNDNNGELNEIQNYPYEENNIKKEMNQENVMNKKKDYHNIIKNVEKFENINKKIFEEYNNKEVNHIEYDISDNKLCLKNKKCLVVSNFNSILKEENKMLLEKEKLINNQIIKDNNSNMKSLSSLNESKKEKIEDTKNNYLNKNTEEELSKVTNLSIRHNNFSDNLSYTDDEFNIILYLEKRKKKSDEKTLKKKKNRKNFTSYNFNDSKILKLKLLSLIENSLCDYSVIVNDIINEKNSIEKKKGYDYYSTKNLGTYNFLRGNLSFNNSCENYEKSSNLFLIKNKYEEKLAIKDTEKNSNKQILINQINDNASLNNDKKIQVIDEKKNNRRQNKNKIQLICNNNNNNKNNNNDGLTKNFNKREKIFPFRDDLIDLEDLPMCENSISVESLKSSDNFNEAKEKISELKNETLYDSVNDSEYKSINNTTNYFTDKSVKSSLNKSAINIKNKTLNTANIIQDTQEKMKNINKSEKMLNVSNNHINKSLNDYRIESFTKLFCESDKSIYDSINDSISSNIMNKKKKSNIIKKKISNLFKDKNSNNSDIKSHKMEDLNFNNKYKENETNPLFFKDTKKKYISNEQKIDVFSFMKSNEDLDENKMFNLNEKFMKHNNEEINFIKKKENCLSNFPNSTTKNLLNNEDAVKESIGFLNLHCLFESKPENFYLISEGCAKASNYVSDKMLVHTKLYKEIFHIKSDDMLPEKSSLEISKYSNKSEILCLHKKKKILCNICGDFLKRNLLNDLFFFKISIIDKKVFFLKHLTINISYESPLIKVHFTEKDYIRYSLEKNSNEYKLKIIAISRKKLHKKFSLSKSKFLRKCLEIELTNNLEKIKKLNQSYIPNDFEQSTIETNFKNNKEHIITKENLSYEQMENDSKFFSNLNQENGFGCYICNSYVAVLNFSILDDKNKKKYDVEKFIVPSILLCTNG
ncbi:conserved Plasmodium protein, unknown function [Plasmodium relictum]|uniref:Uncharacterized protein n=1 Tax=Plasmodium relictum TaxID=85471 RepID=A0A1J1HET5_PLARL|nr:conserved Plasmodium protein, unknown function [Plasmodium relictum]CRH02381.1 conserved Plasmodium protein, unknown function [Plasmodium relictum]